MANFDINDSNSVNQGFDQMKEAFNNRDTSGMNTEKVKSYAKGAGLFTGVSGLVLLGLGGYFAWRNRFRIQQFLESKGVSTNLMNRNVLDTVKSGAAKLSGSAEHEFKSDEGSRIAI